MYTLIDAGEYINVINQSELIVYQKGSNVRHYISKSIENAALFSVL